MVTIPAEAAVDMQQAQLLKKRESKYQDKQGQSIKNVLFKSLGPGPEQSPTQGPLAGKFSTVERCRKFSLDMVDYQAKVRD